MCKLHMEQTSSPHDDSALSDANTSCCRLDQRREDDIDQDANRHAPLFGLVVVSRRHHEHDPESRQHVHSLPTVAKSANPIPPGGQPLLIAVVKFVVDLRVGGERGLDP